MLLGSAAAAGPLPDGGVTAEEVSSVFQEKGFQAELTKDSSGNPLIRSSSGGVKFAVFFYGCNDAKRCDSIQFAAGFGTKGVSAEKMAEWNRSKRFGRAYQDDDHDPWVEMDMDMKHGATSEALASDLDRWTIVLGQFAKQIGQ